MVTCAKTKFENPFSIHAKLRCYVKASFFVYVLSVTKRASCTPGTRAKRTTGYQRVAKARSSKDETHIARFYGKNHDTSLAILGWAGWPLSTNFLIPIQLHKLSQQPPPREAPASIVFCRNASQIIFRPCLAGQPRPSRAAISAQMCKTN